MTRDKPSCCPKPLLGSMRGRGSTTHDTGRPLAWFKESTPGSKTGYESLEAAMDGFSDISADGNAREERYVAAVRYRSLDQVE